MVYLDGKEVENNMIMPEKHKFIGAFRNPNPYPPGKYDVFVCECGQHLWARESVYNHWLQGHLDYLQYQTI